MAASKEGYVITALRFELSATDNIAEYIEGDVSFNDKEKQTKK